MAASMSASSNTMKGAWPPSSSASFLIVGALCAISRRPTGVEPVNDRCRTTGLAHSTLPISTERSLSAVNTLITPSGMPARCASSASASADSGVCSAGLITMVQPAANAGAILRVIIAIGKFHGVIAAQTPIGCFSVISRRSAVGDASTSPFTRLASSANHSTKLAPYSTSPRASGTGLPCSAVISRARSSALATIRSNHRRRMTARSLPDFAAQPGNARCAAAIAWPAAAAS